MRSRKLFGLWVTAIVLVLPRVSAQSFQGGIRGTVFDSGGGVLTIATVSLVDEASGVSRSSLTGAGGEFVFSSLNPSTYTVIAQSPGFKKMERKGVVVGTQEFLQVDMKLEVGQVNESVNVTAEVPLMETTNASTGQVVDNQKLDELPNMGRNPFFLAVKISQNVIPGGDPKFNRMEDQSGSSQISISGGPVTGNNYLLDGISITDQGNHAVIIPSIEAVAEVKLQANTYDAEVGRTGGGTFNTFLKSGTNELHGSAFGYMWIPSLLANNFFANATNTPRPEQRNYNYGGSIGGPVVIPRIYDGHNKTFIWITGEAYRQLEAASTALAVPTALERAGDFSQSLSTKGTPQIIYDPLNTVSSVRQPFPNGVIPSNRINPIGLALASYFPLPNSPTPYYGANNFASTVLQYDRADQMTFKLDHEIKSWWRGSVSYLHYGSREPSNAYFGNIASPGQSLLVRHVDATQANTTLTPRPTWVISLRWGFNRYPNKSGPLSQGFDLTKLGFPSSLIQQLPIVAFPSIGMSDLASYGGGGFSQSTSYSRSFSGSVSKYKGRHNLKAGFDFRAIHIAGTPSVTPGSYSFNTTFTQATPTTTTAGAGASLASMLLGYPSSGSVTRSSSFGDMVNYYGVFFQDDFRVTSRLTLNLGLRYEYETGIHSPTNAFIAGFDATATNPIQSQVPSIKTPGVIEYAGQSGYGTSAGNPNKDKISPRIGLAYAPNSKNTIRGGYGVFWAPIPFSLYTPIGYTQSTPFVASNDNNATPAGSLTNPFPNGVLSPIGNSAGLLAGIGGQSFSVYDQSARSTRIQQFSFDVQRQLSAGFVVNAGYAGSSTSHLVQGTPSININQLPDQYLSMGSALNTKVPNPFYGTAGGVINLAATTVAQSQLLLPFPQFGTISLLNSDRNHARYHSFFVKLQKRLASGVNLLSTYTWSQNMDASDAASNTFNSQSSGPQNYHNLGAEYSLATINTPHRWTSAVNLELPFGKGRKFLNQSGRLLDLAAGGWSVNFATTLQSGFPLAINQVNSNSSLGVSNQRPNATGSSPVTTGALEDRLLHYISPAAFSTAPQYTFGNLARTLRMRGPGQANIDFSMFKTFRIYERFKAQFRAEGLNLTNTPLFYGPNTQFGSPTFGAITTQANFSRVIQLGIRFVL